MKQWCRRQLDKLDMEMRNDPIGYGLVILAGLFIGVVWLIVWLLQ